MCRCYNVKNGERFWVSLDCLSLNTPIVTKDYYCLVNGKFELYENQVIADKKLHYLIDITFCRNTDKKWYELWKPNKIMNGYRFKCIDLGEVNNENDI